MPDMRYRTGTASVVADASIVTLSSALMQQHAMVGDHISINRLPSVEVTSVDGQTQLGIEPWAGATLTNVPYVLFQDSILRATRGQVALDVSKLNVSLNRSGYYYFVGDDQTAPDPSDGDEGQWAQQESTGKRWLKQGGVWVYKGTYAILRLEGNWDSVVTYDQSIIVNRVGKLWQSLIDANLNHAPESSPTQWGLFLAGGDAYDIANFDTDRPESGEDLYEIIVTKNLTFYAGMTDSRARARVGATAASFYSFQKNGTEFARMTFAAGGQGGPQLGVFTCPADTRFDPSVFDFLTVVAPASRDATLSGIAWTIAAYRS